MQAKKYLYLPLSLSLLAGGAQAQISLESLSTAAPKEGFSGNAALSMRMDRGNVEREDYSLGTRLQWHQAPSTSFVVLEGSYGKADGEKNADRTFIHARHIRQFSDRSAGEVYAQQETNTFARIDYLRMLGGGARFTLYKQEDRGNAYFGIGLYRSYQKTTDVGDGSEKETMNRANSYLNMNWQLSPSTVLGSHTQYQPSLDDSKDYRFQQQLHAKVRINTRFALMVSADYRYDNQPPEGVHKSDVTYKTSLTYDF